MGERDYMQNFQTGLSRDPDTVANVTTILCNITELSSVISFNRHIKFCKQNTAMLIVLREN